MDRRVVLRLTNEACVREEVQRLSEPHNRLARTRARYSRGKIILTKVVEWAVPALDDGKARVVLMTSLRAHVLPSKRAVEMRSVALVEKAQARSTDAAM